MIRADQAPDPGVDRAVGVWLSAAMDDETGAYIAITRLLHAYADVINRRAWPELTDLFASGAPVTVDTVSAPPIEIAGPERLGGFIGGAVERFDFFELAILSHVVRVVSDTRATGRLYMVELRQDAAGGGWSNAFGVYHDVYEARGGRWRFAARRYQTLARTSRLDVFPFPAAFRGPLSD